MGGGGNGFGLPYALMTVAWVGGGSGEGREPRGEGRWFPKRAQGRPALVGNAIGGQFHVNRTGVLKKGWRVRMGGGACSHAEWQVQRRQGMHSERLTAGKER